MPNHAWQMMKMPAKKESERGGGGLRLVEVILRGSFHLFMLRSSRQRPCSFPCAWPVVIRSCAKSGYFLCTQIGHKIEWENYLRILRRVRCQKKRGEKLRSEGVSPISIQPTLSTRQRLLNEVADVGDTWSSFQVISSCVLMLPASLGKCSPLSLSPSPFSGFFVKCILDKFIFWRIAEELGLPCTQVRARCQVLCE